MSIPPRPPSSPDDSDPPALEACLEALRPEGGAWPPPAWVRWLFGDPEVPFARLVAAARAAPADADAWLAAVLDDDDLSLSDAPGDGNAPCLAADTLAVVGGAKGIAALVRAVPRTSDEDLLHQSVLDALDELGEPALVALIAARAAAARGSYDRDALTVAIADHPGPRALVREVLLEALEEDPGWAAELCSGCEDDVLLEDMRRRWDAFVLQDTRFGHEANSTGLALGRTLRGGDAAWSDVDEAKYVACREWLGVSDDDEVGDEDDEELDEEFDEELEREYLREDLQDILADAERLKRPDGAPVADPDRVYEAPVEPLARREAPGRNDPCWCGSGKKYKKCHLDADG